MEFKIERTKRVIEWLDGPVEVEELRTSLVFWRKPVNLLCLEPDGMAGVYVTETRELTVDEFDAFGSTLSMSRDWLAGKGGAINRSGRIHFMCLEVTAPGRPLLYVNPEGYDYARYVARVG